MNGEKHDKTGAAPDGSADPPALRFIAGNPTPEEVAAVTVVLTALAGSDAEPERPEQPEPVGGWSDLALRLRRPLPPGPGAWRSSAESWRNGAGPS